MHGVFGEMFHIVFRSVFRVYPEFGDTDGYMIIRVNQVVKAVTSVRDMVWVDEVECWEVIVELLS